MRLSADYDCIVLGAGIAGVTAARELHRAGLHVLVVEGAGRVGGRMYTRRGFVRHPRYAAAAERYPIESGAEYVHVGRKERYREFHEELDQHGFTTQRFPKVIRNRLAFPTEWRRLRRLVPSLLRTPELIPTVTLLPGIEDYDEPADVPAGRYVAARSRFRGRGRELARYTLSSHTPGVLFSRDIERCRAAPADPELDTISVAGIKFDQLPDQLFTERSERRLEREVPGDDPEVCGFDSLPAAIAAQLDDASLNPRGLRGELLLGHRVILLERSESGREVRVTVTDRDGSARVLSARAAVCTFSVGMLKAAADAGGLFGSLLDDDKREALASLEMGPITKFSLEFKKGHWGRCNRMTVMSHPRGCARTFFSAFPRVRGRGRGPFVLTGLLMGRDHRILRELDDEAAVRHLLSELQKVLAPAAASWEPDAVLVGEGSGGAFRPNYLRQDWERDEFALGGNSFIGFREGVGTERVSGLRERLKDPRASLPLFWAGEATAPAYDPGYQPLSVHGAFISGKRVAEDVAVYLGQGLSDDAFDNYYAARYLEPRIAARQAAARRSPLRVLLRERELADVRRFAARGREEPLRLEEALRELYRLGYYAHQHQPRRLRGAGGVRAVELGLPDPDLLRLRELARENALPADAAARALVLRGLAVTR